MRAGVIPAMPPLVAVQAAGYSPVCESLGIAAPDDGGRSHLADGIAIADPPRREEMADVVRDSSGFGVTVTDREIAAALEWLTSRGYVVEPTSAVPLAALMRCIRDGRVRPGARVLLPLTGSGMKVLDELVHVVTGNGHA
jgi:threonine synthase